MVDIRSKGSHIIFQVRQLSVHFCANFSKMTHAYFLFSLQHKDHHSHFYCFLFFATTAPSCFPSTTTIVLPTLLPPPPHNYFHFFSTFLLLSSTSSFSLSNRKWLWQTEHNLKELRKTIISRCFIVYLYLVSFSCMIPVLRNNLRLVTCHSCFLALRWTPKEDWLLDIRWVGKPFRRLYSSMFHVCVGKKSLSR